MGLWQITPAIITRCLQKIESWVFSLQGKGWGGGSIKAEVNAASQFLSKNSKIICVDIGGNKGEYTARFLREFPNARVVIFEPSILNFQILVNKFGCFDNVQVENLAIAHQESNSVTLYSDFNGSGLASLTKRKLDHFGLTFEYSETVRTISFEKYWREKLESSPVDFVKIDIEGHELSALYGFGDAINNVHVIQFEFGGCNIDSMTFFQQFWYFFQTKNFEIFRITPLGLEKIIKYRESHEYFSTTNFIARNLNFRKISD